MPGDELPERLRLAELCRRCRAETARYRRGEPHDDTWCFEVFRRAIVGGDEACWRELVAIYRDVVSGWCRASAGGQGVDLEELVAQTWAKFWRSYQADKIAAATGTAAVLLYLKMCARSVAFDEARGRSHAASLDQIPFNPVDPSPLPDQHQADSAARAAFWEVVNRHLRDERERVLVHLAYELGLKSAQVQAAHPDLFPSVADVYRITRNILERLKRSQELRDWLERDGL